MTLGHVPYYQTLQQHVRKHYWKHFNSKNMTAEFGCMFLFVVHIYAVVY